MDPTGFRIHISINSVARIQYCQGRLVTGLVLWSMLSIMQHILRRYLVILCVMLEELISLHLESSSRGCIYIYIFV